MREEKTCKLKIEGIPEGSRMKKDKVGVRVNSVM